MGPGALRTCLLGQNIVWLLAQPASLPKAKPSKLSLADSSLGDSVASTHRGVTGRSFLLFGNGIDPKNIKNDSFALLLYENI